MIKKLNLFDDLGALMPVWRVRVKLLTILYALAVGVMCFMPQPHVFDGVQTPNIISWGRLRFLLVPFNSFSSLSDLYYWFDVFWVFGQNILNVFLLYPLVLGVLALKRAYRTPQRAILLAFKCSLFIELTQLVLDFLFDINRVFELDDLWTNSLGGYLAYLTIMCWVNSSSSVPNDC